MSDHDETDEPLPEAPGTTGDATSAATPRPAELDPPGPAGEPVPWTRRRSTVAVVAAVVAVAILGTWLAVRSDDDDTVSTGSGTDGPTAIWGHRWKIVGIDEGGKERPLVGPAGAQLVLDATEEGRISFNGCNGGSGGARLDGDRLVVEPMASTEMACVGADGTALMDQDTWVATFLQSKPQVQVDGRNLTLTTADATMELVDLGKGPTSTTISGDPNDPVSNDPDSPLPDPGSGSTVPGASPTVPGDGSVGGGSSASPGADGIWGARWELTQIGSGPGASGEAGGPATTPMVSRPVPARDGSAPVLDASTDGRISYTGCNGGSGSARLDGDRLVVGPVMSTKMACGGAEGEALMAQDATLAAILEAGPTVRIEGDQLTLASEVGTIQATRTSG